MPQEKLTKTLSERTPQATAVQTITRYEYAYV